MKLLYLAKTSGLLGVLFSVVSSCWAGEITAPASPASPNSAMYTLLDVCRYVSGHKITVAKRTEQFTQPIVTTGTATGCSTDSLMALLKGETVTNWAESSSSPANPDTATSARYSFKNICDYLDDSTQEILKRTTFSEPTSAPTATACNINDIMGKIQFWAKVSDIAYLAFQAMNPFFNLEKSLAQPNLFFDALASGVTENPITGNPCPKSGKFHFIFTDYFTDAKGINKYEKQGNQFSMRFEQCQDDKITVNGTYSFTLAADVTTVENNGKTVRTDVQTEILLVGLAITTNDETNTLNGKLFAHEQLLAYNQLSTTEQTLVKNDNSKFQHISLTQTTDDTAQPQLEKSSTDTSGQFTFSKLDVTMITNIGSSEKYLSFDGTVVLTESPKAGDYVIETQTDFQLTSYEDYPYVGKIEIKATSGDNNGLTSTAEVITQADASLPKKVEVKTDANGNGQIDSTKDYLWSELSAKFN